MSVNSENHVLGLWIGGGVTPAALRHAAAALDAKACELGSLPGHHAPTVVELRNMANACHAQLSKIPDPPKVNWMNLL